MSISFATRGIISSVGNNNKVFCIEVPPLLNDSKAPDEAVLDLIQDNYIFYFNDIEIIGLWRARIPRLPNDLIPAMYCFLGDTSIDQRNMPEHKTTIEKANVKLSYYTTNPDVLWNVQQVIKQIVVSNNKVQNTSQIKNTGIRWMELKRFDYDYIYLGEEHLIFNLIASIDVVYQEAYL